MISYTAGITYIAIIDYTASIPAISAIKPKTV